jgi:hypothetical protein
MFTYLLKGTNENPKRNQRGTKEELKKDKKNPPSPILSNSLFIEIDPYGIEFAMMILCHHNFGDVVAQRHNLCVQLRSQNCEFAASSGENCLAAKKKCHQRSQNY